MHFGNCGKNAKVSVSFPDSDKSRSIIAEMLDNGKKLELGSQERILLDEIIKDYRFSVTSVMMSENKVSLVFGETTDSVGLHFFKHVNSNDCMSYGDILNAITTFKKMGRDLTKLKICGYIKTLDKYVSLSVRESEKDARRTNIVLEVSFE